MVATAILEKDIIARISALCDGEDDRITLMAVIAGELFQSVEGFDWVGFYRVVAPDLLKLGPYQGRHGFLVIPFSQGVCGAAARQRKTQIVDDVHMFDGHIACSGSTQSELVIPVFDAADNLIAVLDIDSDQKAFFSAELASQLMRLLETLFAQKEVA